MNKTVPKIEKARQDLIEIGVKHGFQDPQVMVMSRMLDELINEYYGFMHESDKVQAAS